jgi:hypothetical protein
MTRKALAHRVRTRERDPDADPFPFREELEQLYGGKMPEDLGERLRFMEGHFNGDEWKPYRHALIYRYRSMGVPMPEIARRLNRSLATIFRWSVESREFYKEYFTTQDVRDIHAERMAQSKEQRERLNAVLHQKAKTPQEVAVVSTALTQLAKVEDQILKAAGYYEVFNVKGADDRSGGADRAHEFRRDLEEAFTGDGPLTVDAEDDAIDVDFEED